MSGVDHVPVALIGAPAARRRIVEALEGAGFEVRGEGRTVDDAVRLGRSVAAVLVHGDEALAAAIAPRIAVPTVVAVGTAAEPPRTSALLQVDVSRRSALAQLAATIRPRPRVAPRATPAARPPRGPRPHAPGAEVAAPATAVPGSVARAGARPRLVVVGASAGGPQALVTILSGLRPLPVPVLVVQHLHPDFAASLVRWLGRVSAVPVLPATSGLLLAPQTVVVAGAGLDLVVDADLRCHLRPGGGLNVPSIDACMTSVALALGGAAVGVVLTGMGADGAVGLRAMRDRGAATIAQDRSTSAVYGMPMAAVRAGAAQAVLPLDRVAGALHQLCGVTR